METQRYVVGGVALERPFKIRRLGHFGFDLSDAAAGKTFYTDLLGFRVSDPLDFRKIIPDAAFFDGIDDTVGWFMYHGTDHHSFVVFPRPMMQRFRGPHARPEVTINQITWQVGSLREVVDAAGWLGARNIPIARAGRDTPGSNWHAYPVDPEGHTNELYYGIEQIGWFGRSKPWDTFTRGFRETPGLPQISEYEEIRRFGTDGVDLTSGYSHVETRAEKYDVGGVLLARPFKVSRIGPVRLFVDDVEAMLAFYRDRMGLTLTEEVVWQGHRCIFLRVNTEHHSLALYPKALRQVLGLSPHTTSFSFGLQVGDYLQLRNAVDFLKAEGARTLELPPELFPGIDVSAFVLDPDGHALQLYYYMEQIGWDGRPRPAAERRPIRGPWPETVPAYADTFGGEPFLGPIG
ncbi:MAG: VOC family protein [Rhodospirillales bacterium]